MAESMRERARDRFRHQAERLMRLIGLDAPAVILQQEILIMERSARLIDPETWGAAVNAIGLRQAKVSAGFCGANDCEEPLLNPEEWSQHPLEIRANFLGECLSCAKKIAVDALDLEEVEDTGEN